MIRIKKVTITGWYNARFSELTKFLLKEIKRFVNHDSVLPKRHKYQNLVTVLRRGGGALCRYMYRNRKVWWSFWWQEIILCLLSWQWGGAQSAFICTVLPESTIYFQPSNKLQYLWKPTTRQFLEVFMILSFQILIF